MRRFDAVLIDFYGTISAGDRHAVQHACERVVEAFDLPVPAAEFAVSWGERFFTAVETSNGPAFRTLRDCETATLEATIRSFTNGTTPIDPEPYVRDLDTYWRDPPLHDDVDEFFRLVEVPVCCVSNADTEPLMAAIARHKLPFDVVMTSEEARSYKPDSNIFQRALDALGVPAGRTLHIGDSLHSDVAGAAAVGITTVWIRREDRIHDIGTCQPDRTISRLTELRGILA